MKRYFYFTLLFLVFIACSEEKKEDVNIYTSTVLTDIHWGQSSVDIKKLFASKYKLEFSEAISQGISAQSVLKFSSGVFHNLNFNNLSCAFNNDSLVWVNFQISGDTTNLISALNKLDNSVSEFVIEKTLDLELEKEYILNVTNKRKDFVTLSLNPKRDIFNILFSAQK